jgi:sulfite reductase (NADPH) flavoprotein alpha-component
MTSYNSKNPYSAKIKRRTLLNKKGSSKETYEIILDIKNSNLKFHPGDYLGVNPENNPKIVDLCIKALQANGREEIYYDRLKKSFFLSDFLKKIANISFFPSKLLQIASQKNENPKKCEKLKNILENRDRLKEYLASHELLDFLKEFYSKNIPLQELFSPLFPLLPRLYSISSSLSYFRDEIHLTVSLVSYYKLNEKRYGVASNFLCHLAKENTPINVYIQPTNHFLLPNENSSIIMICSGCGIAPFVSFMQERYFKIARGKNWLFFGECNEKLDFYYEDFFKKLEREKFLKITTAFSRDQKEKIYVQHKLLENKKEVFKWMENGSYIYICGSAKKMAKGVENALKAIIQEEKNCSEEEAIKYLINLREENRYLKDVY